MSEDGDEVGEHTWKAYQRSPLSYIAKCIACLLHIKVHILLEHQPHFLPTIASSAFEDPVHLVSRSRYIYIHESQIVLDLGSPQFSLMWSHAFGAPYAATRSWAPEPDCVHLW